MERFKHCPSCEKNNVASNLFCSNCGTDISRQPLEFGNATNAESNAVTKSAQGFENADIVSSPSEKSLKFVKACHKCRKVSLVDKSICTGCGTELSSNDIVDCEGKLLPIYTNSIDKTGFSDYVLCIIVEDKCILKERIPNGLSILGREFLSDHETEIPYFNSISELHCLIIASNDTASIIDVSSNGTFMNDKRLSAKTAVSNGLMVDVCSKKCLRLRFERAQL